MANLRSMTEDEYYKKILEVLDEYTDLQPNFGSKYSRSIVATKIAKKLLEVNDRGEDI